MKQGNEWRSSCFREFLCHEILLKSKPFQAHIQYIFYAGSSFGEQKCSLLFCQHWLLEQDLEDQWCIVPPCCRRPVWALGGRHRAMFTNADWNWFIMAPAFGYKASLLVAKRLSKNASFFSLISLHLSIIWACQQLRLARRYIAGRSEHLTLCWEESFALSPWSFLLPWAGGIPTPVSICFHH